MSSWSNLPIEVVQEIFKVLSKDFSKITICNCAIVCRNWTRSAQNVIYEDIHINSDTRLLQLFNTLENNPQLSKKVKIFKSSSDNEILMEDLLARLPHLEVIACTTYLALSSALMASNLPKLKKIASPTEDVGDKLNYRLCTLLLCDRIENLAIWDSVYSRNEATESKRPFYYLSNTLYQCKRLVDLTVEISSVGNKIHLLEEISTACPHIQGLRLTWTYDSDRSIEDGKVNLSKYTPNLNTKTLYYRCKLDKQLLSYTIHKYPKLTAFTFLVNMNDRTVLDVYALSKLMVYMSKIKLVHIFDCIANAEVITETYENFLNNNKTLQKVEISYTSSKYNCRSAKFNIAKTDLENKISIIYYDGYEDKVHHKKFIERYGNRINHLALRVENLPPVTDDPQRQLDDNRQFIMHVMECCPKLDKLVIDSHYLHYVAFTKDLRKRFTINVLDIVSKCLHTDELKNVSRIFSTITTFCISVVGIYDRLNMNGVADSRSLFRHGLDMSNTRIGLFYLYLQNEPFSDSTQPICLKLCTKPYGNRYYIYYGRTNKEEGAPTFNTSCEETYNRMLRQHDNYCLYILAFESIETLIIYSISFGRISLKLV